MIEPELKDNEKKLASEVEVLTLEVTKLKEKSDELLVKEKWFKHRAIH